MCAAAPRASLLSLHRADSRVPEGRVGGVRHTAHRARAEGCDGVVRTQREPEAPPGIEPGMEDLQSSALPLGHGAGLGPEGDRKITGRAAAVNPLRGRLRRLCGLARRRRYRLD